MLAQIKKNQLAIRGNTQLVQGTVGEALQLAFSDEWAELAITAVFAAGERRRDVVVEGAELTIPWELLSEAGLRLALSFHGAAGNGRIVLRTNIASLGVIRRSFEPSGEEPEVPTPARADQIQALAGQAMALAAAVRAEADSGAFDGADGVSPAIAVTEISGGHRVAITDANGSSSFDVMDGTGGGSITIDDALSGSSTNPVQNKIIKAALDAKGTYSKPSGGIPASDLASGVIPSVPSAASSGTPAMDGAASRGSSDNFARADHVHPSDTSKLDAPSGGSVGQVLKKTASGTEWANESGGGSPTVTEVTVATDGDVSQALDAGKIYHFTGALTSLAVTLIAPASGTLAQWHFDFDSGATAPTLTLPVNIEIAPSFTVGANRHYEIDILNEWGRAGSWATS